MKNKNNGKYGNKMNDNYYKVECKCGAEIQENRIVLAHKTSNSLTGEITLKVMAICEECDAHYFTISKYEPIQYTDIKTDTLRIKKALQDEIIKIIDKETEAKMKEVTNLCNDVDEALEQYKKEKKEEENEVICKCGAKIDNHRIKVSTPSVSFEKYKIIINANCEKCNQKYQTSFDYYPAEYKDVDTEMKRIKKALQEEIIKTKDIK